MTAAHEQSTPLAIFSAVAAFVVLNAGFYYLSGNYFDAHHQIVGGASVPVYSPEQQTHLRIVFAVVSGVLVAVGFLVSLWRRAIAHGLPVVLGLGNLAVGLAAFGSSQPRVLSVTLLVAGGLMLVLAWFSYHRSRAAWSFLVAMCGVFAFTDLFGAPKIRGALEVSLWTTMIVPGLYAIAMVALIQLRGDYVDRRRAAQA